MVHGGSRWFTIDNMAVHDVNKRIIAAILQGTKAMVHDGSSYDIHCDGLAGMFFPPIQLILATIGTMCCQTGHLRIFPFWAGTF